MSLLMKVSCIATCMLLCSSAIAESPFSNVSILLEARAGEDGAAHPSEWLLHLFGWGTKIVEFQGTRRIYRQGVLHDAQVLVRRPAEPNQPDMTSIIGRVDLQEIRFESDGFYVEAIEIMGFEEDASSLHRARVKRYYRVQRGVAELIGQAEYDEGTTVWVDGFDRFGRPERAVQAVVSTGEAAPSVVPVEGGR